MLRRFFAFFILLALLMQVMALPSYAEDGEGTYYQETENEQGYEFWDDQDYEEYYDDNPYEPESQEEENGIQLYEEEVITFDSFTTRELGEVEILRKGVDVSSYQGEIDWAKVKADGVEFAFIRVGYHGLIVDSLNLDHYYKKNIDGALAQGIRVGVYFYSQAITAAEAIAEADYVLERIKGYELSLPVVFDYEFGSYNGRPGRLLAAKLSKDQATAICQAFCRRVEASGYQSMVYANRNFLYNQVHRDKLGSVWMAHYALQTDYQGDYAFWQCTSSGRVNGIRGYADLNFWFDDGTYHTVLPFRDVNSNYWGYAGIRYAYEHGLAKGVSEDSFAPLSEATRGDVATLLYRLMGEPSFQNESPFTDLDYDYHVAPVAWAYEVGVVKGRTETIFDPHASVTRQELVTMLHRLAGFPETSFSLESFEDASSVDDYAKTAIAWAVEQGIIEGSLDNGKTRLLPRDPASREQIAAILMRYDQNILRQQEQNTAETETEEAA